MDVFTKQTEIERYSRMVLLAEIADPSNDYNLNIPRYIDSAEPEDIQDLHAHLHGGIPDCDLDALSGYWTAFPSLRGSVSPSTARVKWLMRALWRWRERCDSRTVIPPPNFIDSQSRNFGLVLSGARRRGRG